MRCYRTYRMCVCASWKKKLFRVFVCRKACKKKNAEKKASKWITQLVFVLVQSLFLFNYNNFQIKINVAVRRSRTVEYLLPPALRPSLFARSMTLFMVLVTINPCVDFSSMFYRRLNTKQFHRRNSNVHLSSCILLLSI